MLTASAATGSGSELFRVSEQLVAAYNRGNAELIRRLMSSELRSKYSNSDVLAVIALCKSEKISDIVRTSLPVSGTRFYGFFAIYGHNSSSSMILEVDPQSHIVFWAMNDDLDGEDFRCSFKTF